ncbi:MFS transporter [Heyndrickxia sp. NPDC080065]|uniref:MFS transporter n=1 Tax=Heyndrickxia sp. NPDC080065 TaxID=3390568 RepID=UPI003CFD902D
MKKNTSNLWTKNFLGVSFTSFFLFLTFYLLMVTLPIYVIDDMHVTQSQIGLVVTVFIISAVIVRPFSGILLEAIGRKKMLLLSLLIFFIASVLYFFGHSFGWLLAIRFFHGIGFGIATTATGAIVANIIPEDRMGEGMGYYATFMNLAMVIGPFLGLTIIHSFSFQVLFIFCGIFSLISFICALFVNIPQNVNKINNIGFKLGDLFEKKSIPISIVTGLLAFGYSGVLSYMSVYAKGLNLVQASSFFFVVYAVFLLASRPFTGKWFDQYGENKVIYPAILLFGIGTFILSYTGNAITLLISGALIGVGYGTMTSGFQTIAINSVEANRRSMATATYFTFMDSGVGLGSFVLGIVAATSGYRNLYLYTSILIIFGLGLYYLLHGRMKSKSEQITRESEIQA